MSDRLYKSRTDRMLTGVSAGIAEYLDADPTLVRVAWVLISILTGGIAVIAYIVLAIITPEHTSDKGGASMTRGDNDTSDSGDDAQSEPAHSNVSGSVSDTDYARRRGVFGSVAGVVLIAIGAAFLAVNFGLLGWWDWGRFWPVLLILAGLLVIIRRMGGTNRNG